jgi:hypothetical protein
MPRYYRPDGTVIDVPDDATTMPPLGQRCRPHP